MFDKFLNRLELKIVPGQVKDASPIVPGEPTKQEKTRIKLSPLSFERVQKVIVRLQLWYANHKIESRKQKLEKIQEKVDNSLFTEKDIERISLKIARLEEDIKIGEMRKSSLKDLPHRKLMAREKMFEGIQNNGMDFYGFQEGPFSKTKINGSKSKSGSSIAEQLHDRAHNYHEEGTKASSMGEQLNRRTGIKESKEDTLVPYIDEEDLISLNERKNLGNNVTYSLKKDEIIQDVPISSTLSKSIGSETVKPHLENSGFNSIEEPPRLAQPTYQKPKEEISIDAYLNRRPTLLEDKENLENALKSLKDGDEYIKKEILSDLTKVNREIDSSVNQEIESSNVHSSSVFENSKIQSLDDMVKEAQQNEAQAALLAKEANKMREEALLASAEKSQLEKERAAQLEEEKRLLSEAKIKIEERNRSAREKVEKEQSEIERNRTLAAEIRDESKNIADENARRAQQLASLREFLQSVPSANKETNVGNSSPMRR